jgi:hypothetical protein
MCMPAMTVYGKMPLKLALAKCFETLCDKAHQCKPTSSLQYSTLEIHMTTSSIGKTDLNTALMRIAYAYLVLVHIYGAMRHVGSNIYVGCNIYA